MFNQIFKITARKGEVYKSVSEHVDKEERGGCELKQRVRIITLQIYSQVCPTFLHGNERVPALLPDPVNWAEIASPLPKG